MSILKYKKQVQLLLSVLPLVAKENCFALHGGMAINLFHHNICLILTKCLQFSLLATN